MDILNWIISPSLAGISASKVWGAIPRFSTPTSISQTVTVNLPSAPPFVLYQAYKSNYVYDGLTMITSGGQFLIYYRDTAAPSNVSVTGSLVHANFGNSISTGQEAAQLARWSKDIIMLNGIYPLP